MSHGLGMHHGHLLNHLLRCLLHTSFLIQCACTKAKSGHKHKQARAHGTHGLDMV